MSLVHRKLRTDTGNAVRQRPANAKNLFEAAGIKVHIRRVACTDSRAGKLLGQVLRETRAFAAITANPAQQVDSSTGMRFS
ncbi:hypothetical protein [Streptomyces malaysiensis]|uniref:hypothetical protein n=1 Tax=Streptomyces malaysiensis TaxID=92644 RepID=UPI002B30D509|nr:hypothetical protein R8789_09255 [Streptomyces malaysiensis]